MNKQETCCVGELTKWFLERGTKVNVKSEANDPPDCWLEVEGLDIPYALEITSIDGKNDQGKDWRNDSGPMSYYSGEVERRENESVQLSRAYGVLFNPQPQSRLFIDPVSDTLVCHFFEVERMGRNFRDVNYSRLYDRLKVDDFPKFEGLYVSLLSDDLTSGLYCTSSMYSKFPEIGVGCGSEIFKRVVSIKAGKMRHVHGPKMLLVENRYIVPSKEYVDENMPDEASFFDAIFVLDHYDDRRLHMVFGGIW